MSSHIFVGEINDVYFISTSGKRISPHQAAQQIHYFGKQITQTPKPKREQLLDKLVPHLWPTLETKILVREYLLQPVEESRHVILFREQIFVSPRRPKGFAGLLSVARQDVGKKLIFLTNVVSQKGRRTYFVSSYGQYHTEELAVKLQVVEAIKQIKGNPQRQNKALQPTPYSSVRCALYASRRG